MGVTATLPELSEWTLPRIEQWLACLSKVLRVKETLVNSNRGQTID